MKNNRPAAVVVSVRRWKRFTAALRKALSYARKGKVFRAGTSREEIADALWND